MSQKNTREAGKKMKTLRNNMACYGCRACQLICSFHHTGEFNPEKSSIKVYRNYVDGNITWSLDSTCDGCVNEKEPLCTKYCAYKAIELPKGDSNLMEEEESN